MNLSQETLDDGCIPPQKWFVDKILAHTQGFTLDCGSGRGLWSRKLRERGQPVIGLDLSLRRLKRCKAEKNNEDVVQGSCTHLPFKSNSFDSTLFIEVIEHIPDHLKSAALQEIHRILQADGLLTMTTPNKHVYSIINKIPFGFKHNPEHMGELTYREAKSLMERFFETVLVDGKVGGRIGRILDRFAPTSFCWDLLIVGRKR